MKKKLTVNTIAFGNIKNRKKQYTIMIIGIILAMVLSSSIVFLYSAAKETYISNHYKTHGYQSEIFESSRLSDENLNEMKSEGIITAYGEAHTLGYAYTDEQNKYLGSNVGYFDKKGKELSNPILLDGKYPQNQGEAAIEKAQLIKLGLKNAKVGDTITLNLDIQNGNTKYYKTIVKKYKLTGILSDKKSIISYSYDAKDYDTLIPAIVVSNKEKIENGGKEKIVYYTQAEKKRSMGIDEYFAQKNISGSDYNKYNTKCYVQTNVDNLFSGSAFVIVIMAVLIFASCVAIINSFNSNLKDRKKQIGMLRAVGTTKRQIINIFGREAFIISLICTPISIIISYLIISLVLKFAVKDAVMTKSVISLLIAAVTSEIVVLLAAFIPLISASRVSPMQAIRDVETARKFKNKKIKSKKEFDVAKHIAKRNLGFYNGSRITVSVILALTIIVSSFGFANVINDTKNYFSNNNYDYHISFANEKGLSEAEKQEIADMQYIGEVSGEKSMNINLLRDEIDDFFRVVMCDTFLPGDQMLKSINQYRDLIKNGKPNSSYEEGKKDLNTNKEYINLEITAHENSYFKNIKNNVEGEINYSKLKTGEEVIVASPKKLELTGFANGNESGVATNADKEIGKKLGRYESILIAETPFKVGDKITFELPDKTVKTATVGAIIRPNSTGGSEEEGDLGSNIQVLTTIDGMRTFNKALNYNSIEIKSSEEVNDKIDEQITNELSEFATKYDGYVGSIYQQNEQIRQKQIIIIASLTSIMIICLAVCASIINNAMSARIKESKKAIGTLRAVGADERELTKSFIYQMRSMFVWGTGIGFGVYIISYFIKFLVEKYYYASESYTLEFYPWAAIGIVIVLFIICSINLWVKVRKEMKNSIVENIREL